MSLICPISTKLLWFRPIFSFIFNIFKAELLILDIEIDPSRTAFSIMSMEFLKLLFWMTTFAPAFIVSIKAKPSE